MSLVDALERDQRQEFAQNFDTCLFTHLAASSFFNRLARLDATAGHDEVLLGVPPPVNEEDGVTSPQHDSYSLPHHDAVCAFGHVQTLDAHGGTQIDKGGLLLAVRVPPWRVVARMGQ